MSNNLNTPRMRASVLESLRLINKWMRDATGTWSPNQTGRIDPVTGKWDRTVKMPLHELPEHNAWELEDLVNTMDAVTRVARSVRDAAIQMRDSIEKGNDPDAMYRLACGCLAHVVVASQHDVNCELAYPIGDNPS